MVARLAEAGVDLVEQPSTGWAFMAEVTAAAAVPIIADETCWDVHDALEVVRQRSADCISMYLAKAGGFVGGARGRGGGRGAAHAPATSTAPSNPPSGMRRISISCWPSRLSRWRP